MNNNQIININGISCYEKDGTAYLNLEAVARGLGFTRVKNDTEYVMWDRVDKYLSEIGFHTCVERPEFIPENIFYRLAMKAKNEAAEKFQAKIADEVIPSIRRHGMYATEGTIEKMLNDPDAMIKVLTTLKEEREQRKALESKSRQTARRCFSPMLSARPRLLSSSATWQSSCVRTAWTSGRGGFSSGSEITATSSSRTAPVGICRRSALWSWACLRSRKLPSPIRTDTPPSTARPKSPARVSSILLKNS